MGCFNPILGQIWTNSKSGLKQPSILVSLRWVEISLNKSTVNP